MIRATWAGSRPGSGARGRADRTTNLLVAALQVPYAAFKVVGGSWTYFYGLGLTLEVVLLVLVLRWAWAWPRTVPSA